MNDFFDQVEHGLRAAVSRKAHLPWYARLVGIGRARPMAVVLAVLVIAAPALGAVTHWFGFGAPDHFPRQPAAVDAGRAFPGTAKLLALRIPDPQGGPPWGLRLVRTTRGDTCIQLGRVEDGRLGSLGIDDAWNNDQLFHPFPNSSEGDDCGTTDAVGDGFVNVAYTGTVASANPTAGARGPQAGTCQPPLLETGRLGPLAAHRPLRTRQSRLRSCPPGSARIVFMGLLGPDATSVTYQRPNHSIETERTSGNDGAYLLVFPQNRDTCLLYTQGPTGAYGPCGGTESVGGASPDPIGAIKAITYRDGHVCRLTRSPAQLRQLTTLREKFEAKIHFRPGKPLTPAQRLTLRTQYVRFLTAHHISLATLRAETGPPSCPAVGYVAAHERHLTSADVESPITVRILPPKYDEFRVDLTFTARQPVTGSSSWYEDYMTNPPDCPSGGQGGEIGFGNVRAGKVIHDIRLIGPCKGTYRGLIGYMQNSGPINQNNAGGGEPGRDGSIVVGRFTFTVR